MWSRGSPRRGGVEKKNLLQIKWRTFSGPTVTHELTHTHKIAHKQTQMYTSHEGTPKAICPATAFQGWVKGMCVQRLNAMEALYLCSHCPFSLN